MKLGLLTFHDAANYGAVLQAYALQAFLESEGYECEYLDYKNAKRRAMYDMWWHVGRSLSEGRLLEALQFMLGMPFMAKRKARFGAFRQNYLKTSAKAWRSHDELRVVDAQYDKFVVGSDQVWNPSHNGGDMAYLLDFVQGSTRKVAYASSFGTNEIPDTFKQDYASCLKEIGRIGVRERAGCRLVKSLADRDVPMVVDPVFLPGRETWERLIPARPAEERPFVFSYTNRKDQLERFQISARSVLSNRTLHKLARQTTLSDFLRRDVQVKYCMSPEEFLRNVRDADLVVTSSFHCMAFALVFNRPFICFLTGNAGKDERLAGLLRELELENRVFRDGMSETEVFAPIDYERVNAKLMAAIAKSKAFLLDALSNTALEK